MKTLIFHICLIITFSSKLTAQVILVHTVSSSDAVQFYYIQNDTADRGLFQAKQITLTLWGTYEKLDKPFIILGEPEKHIVIRYKHHAYILFHESRIKKFIKDFHSDTVTHVKDIIDEGKVTILYFDPNPKEIVANDTVVDLSIKEGTITITYHNGLFKINVKNLVLSADQKNIKE